MADEKARDVAVAYRRAIWRHWKAAATGVVALLIATVLASFGKGAWLILLVIGAVALGLAQFQAWRDMRAARDEEIDKGQQAVAQVKADAQRTVTELARQLGSEIKRGDELEAEIARRDEREDVRLRFEVPMPERLTAGTENVYKLVAQVWNERHTSTFAARTLTPVSEVLPTGHGLNMRFAWEGELGTDVRITKGTMEFLYIANFDANRGVFQFMGPASSYTKGERQTPSKPCHITGRPVEFDLEVRDVEVDVPVIRRVRIEFDEGTNFPRMTISEPVGVLDTSAPPVPERARKFVAQKVERGEVDEI